MTKTAHRDLLDETGEPPLTRILQMTWGAPNFFQDAFYVGMGSMWFKDFEVMNSQLGMQYSS